jgi:hypothetical protein
MTILEINLSLSNFPYAKVHHPQSFIELVTIYDDNSNLHSNLYLNLPL